MMQKISQKTTKTKTDNAWSNIPLCSSFLRLCYNKVLSTTKLDGLKQQRPILSQFFSLKTHNQSCWQRWFLLGILRKNLFYALLLSCPNSNFWHSLACRGIAPISASIFTLHSLCVSDFSFMDTGHLGLRLTLRTSP